MKLFESNISEEDTDVISEVIRSGDLGFGPNVPLFEEAFSFFSNKQHNISTSSASASAFILFAYMQEKYGSCNLYTTSLGFTSPLWAARHFGHTIHFVDVDDNLQFSSKHYRAVREHASSRKTVVMPVLYGGVSNIYDFNLFGDEIVIVDSAHCVTPTINADYIFFSFHPYKPICASDGGMIATDDKQAADYCRSYKNFAREPEGNSYTIRKDGLKFYMNNLNATISLSQLKQYTNNLQHRQDNFKKLQNKFDLLDHDDKSSYYFATSITDEADKFVDKHKIARHYPMLHMMDFYKSGQQSFRKLYNLEKLHSKILNLPLYTDTDYENICNS